MDMKKIDKVKEILRSMDMEEAYHRYVKELPEEAIPRLLDELERVDRKRLIEHRRILLEHKKGKAHLTLDEIEPLEAKEITPDLEEIGWNSLKNGEWADAILAGGAGTRFFSELGEMSLKSKGLFPITPLGRHSFLEFFLMEILSTGISCGRLPLCLIMTSSITDGEIGEWVKKEEICGFPKEAVIIFRQEEHPRLDDDGYLIVLKDGSLSWTGDGHGGIYKALLKKRDGESVLDKITKEGIKYIVIHNVDNILSRPFEPGRLGFHIKGNYLFTMSCVERTDPDEKIGIAVYLKRENRCGVIEYSVCSPEIMRERGKDGKLLLNAGHINTNLISLSAIREDIPPTLYTGKPLRIEERTVMSSSLEFLNQSLVQMLPRERVGVCMVRREGFFSPTKSVRGRDSVDDTRKNLSEYFSRILKNCGAVIEDGAVIEINPCCGLNEKELMRIGIGKNWFIGRGSSLYLCARFGPSDSQPFNTGFTLDTGASFILKVRKPFGNPEYTKERFIKPDHGTAGRVKIGRNVKVSNGVRVEIEIEDDGILEVPDGFHFSISSVIRVGRGERKVLG